MTRSDLCVRVMRVAGSCPVYQPGQEFSIRRGFVLEAQESGPICMHSLTSIMPYYVALSRGVSPNALGLAGPVPGCAYTHCLDPCDLTGGGTVTFEIRPVGVEEA